MSVERTHGTHALTAPQLIFKCRLRPQNGRLPKNNTPMTSGVFQHLCQVEELKLLATWPMDHTTTKLYEQSPTPILHVGPCDLMLSMVPLFPLFLKGKATPTIPHKLRHLKGSAFQLGTADAAAADGRRGSNVYEVSPWLWQFGRGRPCIGGLRRRKGVTWSSDRSEEES